MNFFLKDFLYGKTLLALRTGKQAGSIYKREVSIVLSFNEGEKSIPIHPFALASRGLEFCSGGNGGGEIFLPVPC